jgi:hypothetical protein
MLPAIKVAHASKYILHMEGISKHTADHIFPVPDCWIVRTGIQEALAGVPACGYLIWGFIRVGYCVVSYFCCS